MKKILVLFLAFLCLAFSAGAQPPDLQRKITVQYDETPLELVLADLHKKYNLNFSYANQLIPLQQKVTLSLRNQPLKSLLDSFQGLNVGYQVVGEQVVLKYEPKLKSQHSGGESKVEKPQYPSLSKIEPGSGLSASNGEVTVQPVSVNPSPVPYTKTKWYEPYALTLQDIFQKTSKKVELAAEAIDNSITLKKPTPPSLISPDDTIPKLDENGPSLGNDASQEENNGVAPQLETFSDSTGYETRPFQLSFITPLGTNGIEAGRFVNNVSFNALAGYAAGLDGVEFGGLVNVEKDFVRGAQFAGFANIVGHDVTAGQFAGFANINGGVTKGAQFAGFINLAGDNALAGQFAGFANVTNGSAKGVQFAGFTNVTKGSMLGPQGAGFANINKGSVNGAQFAGFLNTATGKVHGAQLAGFANIATNDIKGAQVAGFINVARKVNGLQVGVVNVADSVDGVQVGLFNFARHGYRRFEVWGSEVLYANIAFKMGSQHFHNIFAVSGSVDGEKYRWAPGFGFGSEWNLSRGLLLNVDAIAWHINDDEAWTNELNLLNQLRANFGIRLGNHTALFAGPTFNVYVSNLYNSENGKYGLDLAPWNTVYDHQSGRTRVMMWPGLNAGIRF